MSAEIVPFPISGVHCWVIALADAIEERDGEEANEYFRTSIAELRTIFQSNGVPRQAVEDELTAFADEVFGVIMARAQHNGPQGGAA